MLSRAALGDSHTRLQVAQQVGTKKAQRRQVLDHPGLRRPLDRRLQIALAAGQAGSPDPYQKLGVSRITDPFRLKQAYQQKLKECEGDEQAGLEIDRAYNQILNLSLSARISGGPKDKRVAYADKVPFRLPLPRLPRPKLSDPDFITVVVTIQGLILLYYLSSKWLDMSFISQIPYTRRYNPLGLSIAVAILANIHKQVMVFPALLSRGGSVKQRLAKAGNFLWGMLQGVMGSGIGMLLVYKLPLLVCSKFKTALPFWLFRNLDIVILLGLVLGNVLMASVYW